MTNQLRILNLTRYHTEDLQRIIRYALPFSCEDYRYHVEYCQTCTQKQVNEELGRHCNVRQLRNHDEINEVKKIQIMRPDKLAGIHELEALAVIATGMAPMSLVHDICLRAYLIYQLRDEEDGLTEITLSNIAGGKLQPILKELNLALRVHPHEPNEQELEQRKKLYNAHCEMVHAEVEQKRAFNRLNHHTETVKRRQEDLDDATRLRDACAVEVVSLTEQLQVLTGEYHKLINPLSTDNNGDETCQP